MHHIHPPTMQASSEAAVAQQRPTAPAWKLCPIWVMLHGPRHRPLYDAALAAWPTFAAELELRWVCFGLLGCACASSPDGCARRFLLNAFQHSLLACVHRSTVLVGILLFVQARVHVCMLCVCGVMRMVYACISMHGCNFA